MREDTMSGKSYLLAQLGDDGNPEVKIITRDIDSANALGIALLAALAIENGGDPVSYLAKMAIGALSTAGSLEKTKERED